MTATRRRLRVFLKRLADASAADDLLQDVWIDIYRNLRRLERPEAFPAWLYRIARDRAYRELRKLTPARPTFLDQPLSEITADTDEYFSSEDADHVRRALDCLPSEPREVLILRFVEGLSYGQIAAVIESPIGTVRSRVRYAKLALKPK